MSDAAPTQPLSNAEIERELGTLRGWKREEGGIRKRFRHASFTDAIAFVNRVAEAAEDAQHHPDIDIRWRNVIIFLTTHEAGGRTALDLELGRASQALVHPQPRPRLNAPPPCSWGSRTPSGVASAPTQPPWT